MLWALSNHADPRAVPLADRHYSRKTIGASQFTPPGRKMVLLTPEANSLWVTSYPFKEYVKHAWGGAWLCALFRNESPHLASELIVQAVAATRWKYKEVPALGMVTMIDRKKVRPTKVRGKDVWGWTFRKAGFVEVGETKGGLLVMQLTPDRVPAAQEPLPMKIVAKPEKVAVGQLLLF